MHSIELRARVAAAALLAAVAVLLGGCGAPPSAPATAPAAVGTDGVARVRFDHRAGDDRPPPVVSVPRAATVELVVGSDTAERVLVPELDQVRYVTAGGTVALRFVASAPGSLTVVLGSGAPVGRIDVGQA